jgi:hypothetical protein
MQKCKLQSRHVSRINNVTIISQLGKNHIFNISTYIQHSTLLALVKKIFSTIVPNSSVILLALCSTLEIGIGGNLSKKQISPPAYRHLCMLY